MQFNRIVIRKRFVEVEVPHVVHDLIVLVVFLLAQDDAQMVTRERSERKLTDEERERIAANRQKAMRTRLQRRSSNTPNPSTSSSDAPNPVGSNPDAAPNPLASDSGATNPGVSNSGVPNPLGSSSAAPNPLAASIAAANPLASDSDAANPMAPNSDAVNPLASNSDALDPLASEGADEITDDNTGRPTSKDHGPEQKICLVCIQAILPTDETLTLQCYDTFHKECIETWARTKGCSDINDACPYSALQAYVDRQRFIYTINLLRLA
jgi:hypothetical protein